jgi:agmatinase
MAFDPDAAAQPGSGIFGLPFTRQEAGIVLIPVPFDATTSYGGGTSAGPQVILGASMQVDLMDHQFGRTYEAGIFMEPIPAKIKALSKKARALAKPIIERGGATRKDAKALASVNAACEQVAAHTHKMAAKVLTEGKIPGLVGGDHSTPLGFIRACAEHAAGLRNAGRDPGGLGILQIDAHMDFRDAFEGFSYSHASIMHNVLTRVPQVTRLVQVGIRDYGEGERDFGISQGKRVKTYFDFDLAAALDDGAKWSKMCDEMITHLPQNVYVSFDIDGLDPSLCPHTGTPMVGGLSFNQACVLLERLARSGRRVVGFDLNEVSPGIKPNPNEPDWDANVGARVLYKLCGVAAIANRLIKS